MNNTYEGLVQQTFNFPQEGFKLQDNNLRYNDVDIKAMFAAAIKKHKYEGEYNYCYCTKSSHFSFVVEEALKHNIHLETSYAYDIEIIKKLYQRKKITKDTFIICNGYKQK